MPKVRMTDRWLEALKPEPGKQLDYRDAITRGLTLRISQAGTKSWFASVALRGTGRRVRLPLGRYPRIKLSAARRAAQDARERAELGQDLEVRPTAPLVRQVVERYLTTHLKNNRTVAETRRRMNKNILPLLGDRRIDSLKRRDITAVIDVVMDRGAPIEASHCFEDLRAMLTWCLGRGEIETLPTLGMKRPAKTPVRRRWLSEEEIKIVWRRLMAANDLWPTARNAIRLIFATGLRVNEACGICLETELDIGQRTLTLPPERTKNKTAFTLPLSDFALELIAEQQAENATEAARLGLPQTRWLFPGRGRRRPLAGATLTNWMGRQVGQDGLQLGVAPWRLHDCRRTMASHLAAMGVVPVVLARLLNHIGSQKAGVTMAVYSHYTYDREAREAAEQWGGRLREIAGSSTP